jgi:hypothetical protein
MGTLSTRPLKDFGVDITGRIEGLSDKVGRKIDDLGRDAGREGTVTKRLERLTAALPSVTWLVAAGLSLAGALTLRHFKRSSPWMFVGMGVPAFLLIGVYNKIVKVEGSERVEG